MMPRERDIETVFDYVMKGDLSETKVRFEAQGYALTLDEIDDFNQKKHAYRISARRVFASSIFLLVTMLLLILFKLALNNPFFLIYMVVMMFVIRTLLKQLRQRDLELRTWVEVHLKTKHKRRHK